MVFIQCIKLFIQDECGFFSHGRKEVFSCRGIRECVQFFRDRGHTDILVFVPQFRREAARSDCPITDQHILLELEDENVLVS